MKNKLEDELTVAFNKKVEELSNPLISNSS